MRTYIVFELEQSFNPRRNLIHQESSTMIREVSSSSHFSHPLAPISPSHYYKFQINSAIAPPPLSIPKEVDGKKRKTTKKRVHAWRRLSVRIPEDGGENEREGVAASEAGRYRDKMSKRNREREGERESAECTGEKARQSKRGCRRRCHHHQRIREKLF